jgi:outer membrane cobalamin receptor
MGLFGEAKATVWEGVSITLGARYDRHRLGEDRGVERLVSPRAAIVVRTGGTSNINASLGKGFRAPTIAEMFTSTAVGGFRVKPNLDLSPEKGLTYEIGWMRGVGRPLQAGIGLFRSDYEDLIEPEVDPSDGNLHFINIRDAAVSGFEGWVRMAAISGLASLATSYMYLSTEDKETGEPLAYRSKHNLKVSFDVSREAYGVGVDFLYRSRVERVKVYEDDERVPMYVTDLRGEIKLGDFRLSGKVANLFNYNYAEIERSLAPIRNFRFSLSGVL